MAVHSSTSSSTSLNGVLPEAPVRLLPSFSQIMAQCAGSCSEEGRGDGAPFSSRGGMNGGRRGGEGKGQRVQSTGHDEKLQKGKDKLPMSTDFTAIPDDQDVKGLLPESAVLSRSSSPSNSPWGTSRSLSSYHAGLPYLHRHKSGDSDASTTLMDWSPGGELSSVRPSLDGEPTEEDILQNIHSFGNSPVPQFMDVVNVSPTVLQSSAIKSPQALEKAGLPAPQCVMCLKRTGDACVIRSQNKGVCNACDSGYWCHMETGMFIKWCKGCKRFCSGAEFSPKLLATKCGTCRRRVQLAYAARKSSSAASHSSSARSAAAKNESPKMPKRKLSYAQVSPRRGVPPMWPPMSQKKQALRGKVFSFAAGKQLKVPGQGTKRLLLSDFEGAAVKKMRS